MKITDRNLKRKYPKLWKHVEEKMRDDCRATFGAYLESDQIRTIAHNAAFIACEAHHFGIE